MASINTNPPAVSIPASKKIFQSKSDFNEQVLNYVKKNKPDGTLNDLLNQLKVLSPNSAKTLPQLKNALAYSDTTLRTCPEYQKYTSDVLDKQTCQLLGLNMLTTTMMLKLISPTDENDNSF